MDECRFDYSTLLGRIREICRTQAAFARAMGMSLPAVNARLNGHRDFSAHEILRACGVLGIADLDIPAYFFKVEV